jgi:hypothetical protein
MRMGCLGRVGHSLQLTCNARGEILQVTIFSIALTTINKCVNYLTTVSRWVGISMFTATCVQRTCANEATQTEVI